MGTAVILRRVSLNFSCISHTLRATACLHSRRGPFCSSAIYLSLAAIGHSAHRPKEGSLPPQQTARTIVPHANRHIVDEVFDLTLEDIRAAFQLTTGIPDRSADRVVSCALPMTSRILLEADLVLKAACCTLDAISPVAAPCCSTAVAMAECVAVHFFHHGHRFWQWTQRFHRLES